MISYRRRRPLISLPLTLLVSALLISSCSRGTDPGPCETFECREISYLLTASRDVFEFDLAPDSVSDRLTLGAVFVPDDPMHGSLIFNDGINAGPVEFNDMNLILSQTTPGNAHYSLSGPSDSLLAPPGSPNRWFVWGSGDRVPPFSAEIDTPPLLRIDDVATAPGDTIDVDVDFTLTWSEGATVDTSFDFVTLYGHGKDGSFRSLTSFSFFGRDTIKGRSYQVPSDSLRAWRSTMISLSFTVERQTIHDVLIAGDGVSTPDRWARLLFRETINRAFHFRP